MEIRTFVVMCNDVPKMVFIDKSIQGNGTYPKDELNNLMTRLKETHKESEPAHIRDNYDALYHWRWYSMLTTFSKILRNEDIVEHKICHQCSNRYAGFKNKLTNCAGCGALN